MSFPASSKLGRLHYCCLSIQQIARGLFSVQNLIPTKLRNRLALEISDKLSRVRMYSKGLKQHNFNATLVIWHQQKKRFLKTCHSVSHIPTKGVWVNVTFSRNCVKVILIQSRQWIKSVWLKVLCKQFLLVVKIFHTVEFYCKTCLFLRIRLW